MKMLKACLNPKMLAGLGGVGVTIYLVAPSLVAAVMSVRQQSGASNKGAKINDLPQRKGG